VIQAVLDANAFASGVLGAQKDTSTPGELFRRWRAAAFGLATSDHLIGEVEKTLREPFFVQRIPAAEVEAALRLLRREAVRATINVMVSEVASHPEDDLVLATAVSAGADYLVTGDRQLLKLGAYEGVEIVSPRDFLDILDRQARGEALSRPTSGYSESGYSESG